MQIPDRVYERLILHADRDPVSGCLISRYSTTAQGYAQIGWVEGGKTIMTLAHRAVWAHENREIGVGMTIDHQHSVCTSRKCVEITHLREFSNYENARRTNGRDWPLGFCVNGHGNEHLVERKKGDRVRLQCLICERAWAREQYHRNGGREKQKAKRARS
jgi:hypothetical protein